MIEVCKHFSINQNRTLSDGLPVGRIVWKYQSCRDYGWYHHAGTRRLLIAEVFMEGTES
jgi:hypothetical protein